GSFKINKLDLSGISSVQIMTATQKPAAGDYIFELHLDAPDGPKVGEATREGGTTQTGKGPFYKPLTIPVASASVERIHDLYFVSRRVNKAAESQLFVIKLTVQRE